MYSIGWLSRLRARKTTTMQKITIIAHSGIGADRVKVGEKEVTMPTTFAEVKSGKFEGWDEARTMARAIASAKIEEQRTMRPSGGLDEEEKALLAEFRAKRAGKATKKKAPVVRNRTREAREAAATTTTPATE